MSKSSLVSDLVSLCIIINLLVYYHKVQCLASLLLSTYVVTPNLYSMIGLIWYQIHAITFPYQSFFYKAFAIFVLLQFLSLIRLGS
jgi:hypothetical protein